MAAEFIMYDSSNCYFRFPSEIGSRLDFVHHHPALDILNDLGSIAKYNIENIESLLQNQTAIISGKTPKGITHTNDGIAFLGGTNVKPNETDLSEPTRIPELYHKTSLANSQLAKDDVLITIAGVGVGDCSVYESTEEANINQAVARLRLDSKKIRPQFLGHFLNSSFGKLAFVKYSHWVLQPNINTEEIKHIKVILPTEKEQLSILNKIKPKEILIKSLKAQIEKLQNESINYLLEQLKIDIPKNKNYFFKTGAEKQTITFAVPASDVFGRINYLFFHPKFIALQQLKNNFKTVTLESICSRQISAGVQPIFTELGSHVALKTIDLKNKYIDVYNALKVTEDFFNANKFAEVQNGDIILAATGYVSMGKVDVFENDEPALISGELLSFKLNANYDPYFITYYLRSHLGQIQIEKYWTGSSGQIHLSDKDVKKFIIPSCESIPLKRQKEISQIIRGKIEQTMELELSVSQKQIEVNNLFESLLMA